MIVLWIGFLVLVFALLAFDLGVLNRRYTELSTRQALGWTMFWVSLGLGFSLAIYFLFDRNVFGVADIRLRGEVTGQLSGGDAVLLYITGYLLEESLSIDNIFVISLLMRSMAVPKDQQRRVLFWGVIGAIGFRAIMIVGGVWLVHKFTWTFYFFGGFLILSGLRMLMSGSDDSPEPEKSWFFRIMRRALPVAPGQHGSHFLVKIDGRTFVTQLFIALLAIELTDILFAVDSVPAVLGVTDNTFLVVTSNVFAILGLRSLYFVLAGMMDKFHHLKSALAVLLVVIGGKMVAHHYYKLPNLVSLGLVVVIVGAGVVFSMLSQPKSETPNPPIV